jgi:hypothetical protein
MKKNIETYRDCLRGRVAHLEKAINKGTASYTGYEREAEILGFIIRDMTDLLEKNSNGLSYWKEGES